MTDTPPSVPGVDGIAAPRPQTPSATPSVKPVPAPNDPAAHARKMLQMILLTIVGIPYLAYLGWSVYLLTILPDPTGVNDPLIPAATFGAVAAALLFIAIAAFSIMRINKAAGIPTFRRRIAMIRIIVGMIPGIAMSIAVPLLVTREPALSLTITSPEKAADFVAPLTATFSAADAVEILKRKNLVPEKFSWDFEGDGKMNDQTLDPVISASYDRVGVYNMILTIQLKGGGTRTITKRITILQAVFAVDPNPPIVDEMTRLSVAQLLTKPEDLVQAYWDFDGNGEVDLATKNPDVVHTFYADGSTKVVVVVKLANNSQHTYERVLNVIKSVPLPFEATVKTDPENLIGPSPLGVVFRTETKEPLRVILWNFGDGSDARGDRAGHTYTKEGVFSAVAELRAENGKVAKITKVVRVVPELTLPDLEFIGTPDVNGNRISGEVPVVVDLKPRTTMPLIDFMWEAPEATTVGSTKGSVHAVYRREGTYTLTLIAQDPDNRVMRKPITVEVKPPSSTVAIRMDPEGGVAPLTVRFDASESFIPNEEISGFEWVFGDEKDTGAQQRGAQVTHVYRRPGTYTVQVKVYTTSGKQFDASKTIVVRAPVIDSCISASRTEGKAPLGVRFSSDCSTVGADTVFEWDFGDGWKSPLKNPTHDFQKSGTYSVILILKDGENTSQSDPLSVIVEP
ncbi:MAG: PKD domain-containing protein [Candidatus Peribacteraceae bacterium]|nr:PKD domain-containing protein [Candidatus Peribacteraceae bacterium]MDD5074835.1 PKD domain-containing protein [Candidatus Peribacteraceae bacterium]